MGSAETNVTPSPMVAARALARATSSSGPSPTFAPSGSLAAGLAAAMAVSRAAGFMVTVSITVPLPSAFTRISVSTEMQPEAKAASPTGITHRARPMSAS
jgi:hypothetical protein